VGVQDLEDLARRLVELTGPDPNVLDLGNQLEAVWDESP
jgi:hypothetical protein